MDLRNDILGRFVQSPDVCENNSENEIENGGSMVFRNISCILQSHYITHFPFHTGYCVSIVVGIFQRKVLHNIWCNTGVTNGMVYRRPQDVDT